MQQEGVGWPQSARPTPGHGGGGGVAQCVVALLLWRDKGTIRTAMSRRRTWCGRGQRQRAARCIESQHRV